MLEAAVLLKRGRSWRHRDNTFPPALRYLMWLLPNAADHTRVPLVLIYTAGRVRQLVLICAARLPMAQVLLKVAYLLLFFSTAWAAALLDGRAREIPAVAYSGKGALSNAQRFARGLPPNRPKKLYRMHLLLAFRWLRTNVESKRLIRFVQSLLASHLVSS